MLDAEGIPEDRVRLTREIDMRYVGQWRALPIEVDGAARVARPGRRGVPRRARARAHLPPRGLAGRGLPAQRARGRRDARRPSCRSHDARRRRCPSRPARARSSSSAARTRSRRPSIARDDLPAGASFEGPALIDQLDSTVARPARGEGRGRRVAQHPHADRAGGRVMSTETDYKLDPVTLRGPQERVRHDRRRDGGADPAHLPLVRHLLPRLLLRAVRRARATRSCRAARTSPSHVGTLHLTAKAVIEAFGDDIHEGDLFAINDPYSGGTHFNDVRIIRPIFHDGELIAFSQSNGHWADVGGSVPGSFDVSAKEHFGEGIRIPPVRICRQGRDARRRRRADRLQHARRRATPRATCAPRPRRRASPSARSCGCARSTAATPSSRAFEEVQDYVERLTRKRIAELPDGTWETEDYIDFDPAEGEGLVPVKVQARRSTASELRYDLSGSHPAVAHVPELELRHDVLGHRRRHEDVLPGRAAELRLLPRDRRRRRRGEHGRQRRVAGGGHRLLLRRLREGHERGLSSCGRRSCPSGRWRAASTSSTCWSAGATRAPTTAPCSCGTTGWSAAGAGATARTARTAPPPVFGVGLAVQPLEGQERLTPGADHRAPDRAGLRRARALPRRRRRAPRAAG